jgi:hypothetical protein
MCGSPFGDGRMVVSGMEAQACRMVPCAGRRRCWDSCPASGALECGQFPRLAAHSPDIAIQTSSRTILGPRRGAMMMVAA